ncbi:hypothetical protein CBM2609_A170107 [Cupriavidus taiwanensis]|nr:hypothetical protein CBM2604_A140110 [Cupriavidus taiwanensis]SOZ25852.1 hypothetical protein CBM2609_A170107 [Cupriavidus taiwanensis]SOZ45053.1 hypothetical protein CBM2610_A160106 [Cupriavidus taiwanensis]
MAVPPTSALNEHVDNAIEAGATGVRIYYRRLAKKVTIRSTRLAPRRPHAGYQALISSAVGAAPTLGYCFHS